MLIDGELVFLPVFVLDRNGLLVVAGQHAKHRPAALRLKDHPVADPGGVIC